MALSYNEQFLISAGKDGCVCIWKLYYTEGKVGKVGKDVPYTNEVLISRRDLEEKIQTIRDLTVRVKELETEHAYKLRHIDVVYNEKIRDIHQAYNEAIDELRNKIESLQEEHQKKMDSVDLEIAEMKAGHNESMKQLENNYEAKLITEYDKYLELEEHTLAMRRDYEKQLEDLAKQKDDEREKLRIDYEAQLHEKKLQLEEALEKIAFDERVCKELIRKTEDDASNEIVRIRTVYESQLHEQKEQNRKLKIQADLMRNKFTTSQAVAEELKEQVQRAQSEYGYFQETIQAIEKTTVELKNEIRERDATIQEKERHIYEMNQANQELEKFKTVLSYKITELKNQIEPRDTEIKELKSKIVDMEVELVNLHKTNVSLELQLHELREKLKSSRQELHLETQHKKRCQQVLKRIRSDIHDASGLVQQPQALKSAIINLYHRYSSTDEFLRSRKADMDAYCEFKRQREHLERTVASLKKQVFPSTAGGDHKTDKIVEENVILIAELNALREELKDARKHILHMEALIGSKDVRPSDAKKKLEKACYGHEALQNDYKSQIQDCEHIVAALKEDVHRLLAKLSSLHEIRVPRAAI